MAVNKTLILEKQAWPLSPATSMTLFCWDLGAMSVKKEERRSWVAQQRQGETGLRLMVKVSKQPGAKVFPVLGPQLIDPSSPSLDLR